LDNKAGQKRRGDEWTIGLCPYHHRGIPPEPLSVREAEKILGPSRVYSPRTFREKYGTDDELLEYTNKLIREAIAERMA
jgi:hypothetical protein